MPALRFAIDGRIFTFDNNVDPQITLGDFMAANAIIASKQNCFEGGCGACVTLLSRYNKTENKINTISINSCLRKIVTLNNCLVTTTAGLGSPENLNPIQKRFHDMSGTQCGFCGPGFISVVAGAFLDNAKTSMLDIEEALAGNLCRCSPQGPLAAAQSLCSDSNIVDTLKNIENGDENNKKVVENNFPVPLGTLLQQTIENLFPPEFKEEEEQDENENDEKKKKIPQVFTSKHQKYYRCTSVDEAVQAVISSSAASASASSAASSSEAKNKEEAQQQQLVRIVCSQTSNGVYKNGHLVNAPVIVDISNIPEFSKCSVSSSSENENNFIYTIGASVTIAEVIKFLHDTANFSNDANEHQFQVLSSLAKVLNKIANVNVRGTASLCGNLMMARSNGFASDAATPLCALQTRVVYTSISTSSATGKEAAESNNDNTNNKKEVPLLQFLENSEKTNQQQIVLLEKLIFELPKKKKKKQKEEEEKASVDQDIYRLLNYRQAIRSTNAHAIVNSSFLFHVTTTTAAAGEKSSSKLESCLAVFGNVGESDVVSRNAPKVVNFCSGEESNNNIDFSTTDTETVVAWAGEKIQKVLSSSSSSSSSSENNNNNNFIQGNYKNSHRKRLVASFVQKAFSEIYPDYIIIAANGGVDNHNYKNITDDSNSEETRRQASHSVATFVKPPTEAQQEHLGNILGKAIPRPDGIHHACGTAAYTVDQQLPSNGAFAAFITTKIPAGIFQVDYKKIEAASHPKTGIPQVSSGFIRVFTADYGVDREKYELNTPSLLSAIGLPMETNPIWALDGEVQYFGQPIGIVVAETQMRANLISRWIRDNAITFERNKKPIITLEHVHEARETPEKMKQVDLGPMSRKTVGRGVFVVEDDETEKNDSSTSAASASSKKSEEKEKEKEKPTKKYIRDDIEKRLLLSNLITQETGSTSSTSSSKNENNNNNINIKSLSFTPEMDSQLHFYMEPNACVVIEQDRKFLIYAQSQMPSLVPKLLSLSLKGRPICDFVYINQRIGGSFGSRLSAIHAISCTIAASILRRPIKMIVERETDSQQTGGREETSMPCKVYYDADSKKILAVDAVVHKNSGHRLELSFFQPLAMTKSLFSCYYLPSLFQSVHLWRTNLPSRGPTRSPGEIEGAYLTESIIDRVAHELSCHSQEVRDANMMTLDTFQMPIDKKDTEDGMEKRNFTLPELMDKMMNEHCWKKKIQETQEFNKNNKLKKRGAAVVPFRYFVTQSRGDALVNIYTDGSVVIHSYVTNMGQGADVILLQACATELSKLGKHFELPIGKIRLAPNDTAVIPLQWITGGSTSSESAVLACIDACKKLVETIKNTVGAEALEKLESSCSSPVVAFEKACDIVVGKRVPLSAVGIANGINSGVDYSIFCVGGAKVEVDVLTGETEILEFDILYDSARALNPSVAVGQNFGAVTMGLGYMMQETVNVNENDGSCASGTWEYKPFTAPNLPRKFNVSLLQNFKFLEGVNSSKATGEPPLCCTPCITSACRQAIQSVCKDRGSDGYQQIPVPFTNERIGEAMSA